MSQARRWRTTAVSLAWAAALIGGLLYFFRLEPAGPTPPGWTFWRGIGTVRTFLIAPDGVYAGGSSGLFRLNPDGTADAIEIPGARSGIVIESLALDAQGALWVGHSEGLAIRANSKWTTLGEADGLPSPWVKAIHLSPTGVAWIGTKGGAVRMPIGGPWDRRAMQVITAADGLAADNVTVLAEDQAGGIWFGSDVPPAGGVTCMDAGHFWHWRPKDGLPHPSITSLLVDAEGAVWLGCGLFSQGGAAIFQKVDDAWKLTKTVPTEELAGPKVRSIYQDRQQRMWLGSEYDGLTVRHADRTVRILDWRDGLPVGEVSVVVEDQQGAIWIGTQGGAVRLSPEALAHLFSQGRSTSPDQAKR